MLARSLTWAGGFDHSRMAPILDMAMERSWFDYGVRFRPLLYLYDSAGCSELLGLEAVVKALSDKVDLILGPGCTDELLVAAKLITVYRVPLTTGSGSLVGSTRAWPYVRRTAHNTLTQSRFFVRFWHRFWLDGRDDSA